MKSPVLIVSKHRAGQTVSHDGCEVIGSVRHAEPGFQNRFALILLLLYFLLYEWERETTVGSSRSPRGQVGLRTASCQLPSLS